MASEAAFIAGGGTHPHKMAIHQKHATAMDTLDDLVGVVSQTWPPPIAPQTCASEAASTCVDISALLYELDDMTEND